MPVGSEAGESRDTILNDSGDASIEIWFEDAQQRSWMIELSLSENRILARAEVFPDGSRKLFVLPKDEFKAREIVREIVKGQPPV